MVENPYIGRIVTLASPLIGSVAVAIANWAQDLIGADLDGTRLTVFLTGVFASVLYIVAQWLKNRGVYENLVERVDLGILPVPPTIPAPDDVPIEPAQPPEGSETMQPPVATQLPSNEGTTAPPPPVESPPEPPPESGR